VQGALLVAPADPERRAQLADFAPVPYAPLPYRSVLVASSNDPYCPIRRAGAYARAWGSEFVRLQNAGHINVESGFGDWPLGLALLQSLMQGDSWQPAQPRPAVRAPRVAGARAAVPAGAGAPWAAGL
ncbi:RBBP9/YdeN family alpha/beta hydrolase, partial [Delftia tsuruhatensis]